MKILLVHNYYGSEAPSGENEVVRAERNLLRSRGHEVGEFFRHSDEIRRPGRWGGIAGALRGGLVTPWNPRARREILDAVDRFAPDVVHVHNTFPIISPAIFSALAGRAARVLTLHNYRLYCAAAIPARGGEICTECLDRRSALPGLIHGCYRGSRLATLPLAAGVAIHRRLGTWDRQVDAFIHLTEFQRERMIAAGLRADLSYVKPNFFPGSPTVIPWASRTRNVVYVGRLSAEKGVSALIVAWRLWKESCADVPELRVVGDGPLRAELESKVEGLPIRFLGQLSSAEAQGEIARAMLVVVPSQWFEGFPMVLREAFAFGTPIAASNIGALPSIVAVDVCGKLFNSGDSPDMVRTIREMWESPEFLQRLGRGARSEFESRYAESENHTTLLNIYSRAIATSQLRTNLRTAH